MEMIDTLPAHKQSRPLFPFQRTPSLLSMRRGAVADCAVEFLLHARMGRPYGIF
jgi:hypothetical protein